jgi:hypothetical protein
MSNEVTAKRRTQVLTAEDQMKIWSMLPLKKEQREEVLRELAGDRLDVPIARQIEISDERARPPSEEQEEEVKSQKSDNEQDGIGLRYSPL